MAIVSNLVIDQGTTFQADIDVTDAAGDALNLTGYTAAGQMRKTYASTTATDFTASIQSASGGTVRISLSATQTTAIKAGRYVYDVEITKTSTGEITRVIEGQIEVTPGVTRA
tara:strand:- start:324 stop:662 length:339 start_codon:yes stop_codon:yes gene_type:complete